jgi:1-phosphofructokinase/tagatose 6-phosphate kinase
VLTVLDAEGDPFRLGVEAEPYLVSPNLHEAEGLVGHEFVDDEDLATGLDEIVALGARNAIVSHDRGCWALLREERADFRVRATAPLLDVVSSVGAGDTLLAGFLAARLGGRSFEDAVRQAVAAGAASVLEAGPGRFDPREASRLTQMVTVEPLEHVGHETG